jgi:hypothetical protein
MDSNSSSSSSWEWKSARDKFIKAFNTESCDIIQSVRYWQSLYSLFQTQSTKTDTVDKLFVNKQQLIQFSNILIKKGLKENYTSNDTNSSIITRGAIECLTILARAEINETNCLLFEHDYKYMWIEKSVNNTYLMKIRVTPNALRTDVKTRIEHLSSNNCQWIDIDMRLKVEDKNDWNISIDEQVVTIFSQFFELDGQNSGVVVAIVESSMNNNSLTKNYLLSIKYSRDDIQNDSIYGSNKIREIVLHLKRRIEPTPPLLYVLKSCICDNTSGAPPTRFFNIFIPLTPTTPADLSESTLFPLSLDINGRPYSPTPLSPLSPSLITIETESDLQEESLKLLLNILLNLKRHNNICSTSSIEEVKQKNEYKSYMTKFINDSELVDTLLQLIISPYNDTLSQISSIIVRKLQLVLRIIIIGVQYCSNNNVQSSILLEKTRNRILINDTELDSTVKILKDIYQKQNAIGTASEGIILSMIKLNQELYQLLENSNEYSEMYKLLYYLRDEEDDNNNNTEQENVVLLVMRRRGFVNLFGMLPLQKQYDLLITDDYLIAMYQLIHFFAIHKDVQYLKQVLNLLKHVILYEQQQEQQEQEQIPLTKRIGSDLIREDERVLFHQVNGRTIMNSIHNIQEARELFQLLVLRSADHKKFTIRTNNNSDSNCQIC